MNLLKIDLFPILEEMKMIISRKYDDIQKLEGKY
jgi:hypothetical protein